MGRKTEEFRSLFEDAPVAYHEIDRHGIVRQVNRAECKLLGYEREHLIGRPIWEVVSAEQRELSRSAVQQKLAGQLAIATIEREYTCPDGRRLRIEIHETLIRDEAGAITGIRTAMLDITERRRAEQELDRFFALSLDMLCIADFQGFFVRINPAWSRVLGYSTTELLSHPYVDLVHTDDRAATVAAASQLSNGQDIVSFEIATRPKTVSTSG